MCCAFSIVHSSTAAASEADAFLMTHLVVVELRLTLLHAIAVHLNPVAAAKGSDFSLHPVFWNSLKQILGNPFVLVVD